MPELRRLARHLPAPMRTRLRGVLTRVGVAGGPAQGPTAVEWAAQASDPWAPCSSDEVAAPARCNICRWSGPAFEGPAHCEFALCPRCGSNARDRFLFWCFVRRTPRQDGPGQPELRVLETSPRLGREYRKAMARWFFYRSSDYDERAHRADLHLDLQQIALPDASVDVLLTPHVLEHVPDTDAALADIARVLAPGGRMFLQVPVLQGHTAPPEEPEFHADDTPVFWRFGYDLTDRLRQHFETTVLVPERWAQLAAEGAAEWPDGDVSPEFDVRSMLGGIKSDDLTVVANAQQAGQIGAVPAYMFITWECIRPS